jgi:hypothetical protein
MSVDVIDSTPSDDGVARGAGLKLSVVSMFVTSE